MDQNYLEHENVTTLKIDDRQIVLVGTAHVSHESVVLVKNIIDQVRPDTIAVELCDSRYQSLKNPDRWKNLDLYTVIREGKAFVLIAQLILSSFQKKIAKDLDIKPGAEMMEAIKLCEEQSAHLVLADRDVKTTLKRTWANLSFWQSMKVLSALLTGLFSNQQVSAEEIEKLKKADALEEAMKEFAKQFPAVRESLIDERDQYLAEKVRSAQGQKIVAVLGAGHLPGVQEYIKTARDLAPLEIIPPPSTVKKYLSWTIPSLFFLIILYFLLTGNSETAASFVYLWIVVTASLAALGAVVVRAHPLTILSAALSAPLTTLHPLISVGMIAGLVEAYLRRPRVSDLETIAEDLTSWNRALNNQAIKILLVLISTNFFTSLPALTGMLIGAVSVGWSLITKIF